MQQSKILLWLARSRPGNKTKSARLELKGASLVSLSIFLLNIILSLILRCRYIWDLFHGHCQFLIACPPKLTFIRTSLLVTAIPVTLQEFAESVFNQSPKAGHVGFVTDTWLYTMYKHQSIKSYEHSCRGTALTRLWSGARSRTPRDWKSFMSNGKNKTQLISLLLAKWSTDKYTTRLVV